MMNHIPFPFAIRSDEGKGFKDDYLNGLTRIQFMSTIIDKAGEAGILGE